MVVTDVKVTNSEGKISLKFSSRDSKAIAFPYKLKRVNKENGEEFVHVSYFGAPLEWGKIEALGTTYLVDITKMNEIIEDLEYFDPESNYFWV